MDQNKLGICLEKTYGHSYMIREIRHDDQFVLTLGDELIVWDKSSLKPITTLFYAGFVSSFDFDEEYIYTRHGDMFVIWKRGEWTAQRVLRDISLVGVFRDIRVDEDYVYTINDEALEKRDKSTLQLVSSASLPFTRFHRFMQSIKLDDEHIYSIDTRGDHLCKWSKESLTLESDKRGNQFKSILVEGEYLYVALPRTIAVLSRSDFTRHSVLTDLPADVSCFTVRDETLYVGFENGTVMIFDSNLEERATLKLSDDRSIYSIDVDESRIYIGVDFSSFIVLDIDSHEEVLNITNKDQRLSGFGIDTKYIYSRKSNGEMTVWSKEGDIVHQMQVSDEDGGLSIDDQFVYVGYNLSRDVRLIAKSNWSIFRELHTNGSSVAELPRSEYLYTVEEHQVKVWSKSDCHRIATIRSDGLEELGYEGPNTELDGSKVLVLTVDSDFIYMRYGYPGALLIWDRLTETFTNRLDCGGIHSISFDEKFMFVSQQYGQFTVWRKKGFSPITTLDLKVTGSIFQDEDFVYITGKGIAIVDKKTWTHKATLHVSSGYITNIESQSGFIRFTDWYGQQMFGTRETWSTTSKAETPWRDTPTGSVYARAGGNLVLIPAIEDLKNLQNKWKKVIRHESPLVLVGQQSPTIAIVETWYLEKNMDAFRKYFGAIEKVTESDK
jgi:hypothetical protein